MRYVKSINKLLRSKMEGKILIFIKVISDSNSLVFYRREKVGSFSYLHDEMWAEASVKVMNT